MGPRRLTPIKPGNIGQLVCTVDGVIAESNRLLKAGDVVSPDLFKFLDGLEVPKAGDRILCPKSPSHYVYFRNKETNKIVPVGGSLFHGHMVRRNRKKRT